MEIDKEKTLKARKELFYWQYGGSDCFTALLFVMFQKADSGNFQRLARGFPEEAGVYLEWYNSPSQDELFKAWGFERPNPHDHTIRSRNESSD